MRREKRIPVCGSRSPPGHQPDFKGLDFSSGGTLFVGSVDGRIFRINAATGVAVLAVSSKISISGLAFDPATGELWASIRTHATLRDRIYRIDLATGDTVSAGNTGFNQPLADLAFDEAGNLFGLIGSPTSSLKYRLARIDKSTGAGTEIGSVGLAGMVGIAFSPTSVETRVDLRRPGRIAAEFGLEQNYPNPFNPTTSIKYTLPASADVRLGVYDLLGREVSVLVNGRMDAGIHDVRFDGSGLAAGVYYYRLQAGEFVQTKSLLHLK